MYLLFSWLEYEAGGGMRDLKGKFATLEEAKAAFNPAIGELYGKPFSPYQAEIYMGTILVSTWGGWKNGNELALEWIDE